jgi:type I restriction enzyme M protein
MQSSGDFLNKLWSELDRQRSSVLAFDRTTSPAGLGFGQGASHRFAFRGQLAGLIAALLFFRWLDHEETEREAVAAFDDTTYEPTIPDTLRWSRWSKLRGPERQLFLVEELPQRLRAIDGSPHRSRLQRLATVLELDLTKPASVLDSVLDWISELDMTGPSGQDTAARVLDDVVLWAVEESRDSGAYYTPQGVADLMVELADPQPGNRIYDPCFGSAGLLVGCARRLKERAKQLPLRAWNDLRTNSFFGVEINPIWYVIGMTRLVLSGIPEPGLELGDALERSSQKLASSEKFDVIVACPPWGGMPEVSGRVQPGGNFRFRSKDFENLFLQYVAESLRPGGKAVIALPEGTLFRPGTDRQARQWLLEEFRVDGVISLPAGTFAPYTNLKSNLVVFRRERSASKVRFCVVHSLAGAEKRPSSDSELPTDVARRFRLGAESDDLWETPIKDLALREWELVAKSSGVDQLQQQLDAIREADDTIPVKSLGTVAEVFTGASYDRRNTVEETPADSSLPGLIRVSDVLDGKVGQPTLFLTQAAQEKLHDRLRLRSGDILTSTSGTIGKVAVVQSPPSPIFASKSVVVIRPKEGVSPGYLMRLMQSKSYQVWLTGHARGSTIQHLSVRTLRHLPIPLPALQLQQRISEAFAGDVLMFLVDTITGRRRDPVVDWLESAEPVKAVLDQKPDRQTTHGTLLLERLADSCREIRNRTEGTLDDSRESMLTLWIIHFTEALNGLRGLSRIPDGTAQLSILEGTLTGIARASKYLEDRALPGTGTALSLERRVEGFIYAIRERLLDNVEIRATIDPEIIPAGRTTEVVVRLRNQSSLPLRNFSVNSAPPMGRASLVFLQERQEVPVTMTIPAPETPGYYDFEAKWRGSRLDGRSASGRIPLRLEVRDQYQTATAFSDLGTSPYIVGNPVDRQDMLFGRDDVIDRIKRQLSATQSANVILLEGNRRTGKTSILQRLAVPGELPDWMPVTCSFQGGEGADGTAGLYTREVFRLMAREIGWQACDAGVETWFPDIPPPDPRKKFKPQFTKALASAFTTDRPFEVFEIYIQEALKACRPRRLLLMLDEFDKLQEGIDSGITSPQVPENIRYLIHKYPDLSAILTGSRRLKRLREEYWSALFGFGHRIGISALPPEAARLLVTRPVEGRLVYVDEARDRLVGLCACHPFLVQSLCNRVFEDAVRDQVRTITVSIVETAAHEMVQDNEHFRTLWGYAGTERRRVLLALVERLAGGPDLVTFSLLEAKLEEFGIPVPQRERLGDDIEFLRELELLDLDSRTTVSAYHLAVPLLGEWIHRNVDFDDLRQKAIKEGQEKLK